MISVFTSHDSAAAGHTDIRWQQEVASAMASVAYIEAGPSPDAAAPFIPELSAESVSETSTPEFSIQENAWLQKHQTRFLRLVRLNALEKITAEQKKELDRLQALRRSVHHPRSAEEIIQEHQRRTATRNLMTAIQRYVSAYGIKGQARPAS